MSDRIIVIGGGHNGLTAAARLAGRGRSVLVVEARDRLGGLAAGEEIEAGYTAPGLLHDTRCVAPEVVSALDLEKHGLRRRRTPAEVSCPGPDGKVMRLAGDQLEGDVAEADAAAYARFRDFIGRVRGAVRRLLVRPPLAPLGPIWPMLMAGLLVRRLGAVDMTQLLRIGPMCAADWMRDSFENERLCAAVAGPALIGSFFGPWAAGTAANLLITECLAESEVVGGPTALVEALAAAARAAGAEIRTEARVARITTEGSRVGGVVLEDGEQLAARAVVASCHPKRTFLGLIGRDRLPAGLVHDIENIRSRGTTAAVRLALSGPLEDASGQVVESLRTGESLDHLERAFDAAKYRRLAEPPILDVRVPTVESPQLAPEGHHVVSILAHAAPHDLDGGWTDEQRQVLGDRVVAELARFCPTLTDRLVARQVLTPADIADRYGLDGGHVLHGEHALDQLLFLRPTSRCAAYRTPVEGLVLCGSGSHPGGGITCLPGWLGAGAVLDS